MTLTLWYFVSNLYYPLKYIVIFIGKRVKIKETKLHENWNEIEKEKVLGAIESVGLKRWIGVGELKLVIVLRKPFLLEVPTHTTFYLIFIHAPSPFTPQKHQQQTVFEDSSSLRCDWRLFHFLPFQYFLFLFPALLHNFTNN